MTEKSTKRESTCRICGDRLSYLNEHHKVRWKSDSSADDQGLVCGQCTTMARLQKLREDKRNKKDE